MSDVSAYREAIGRFDEYLFRIRLQGMSLISIVMTSGVLLAVAKPNDVSSNVKYYLVVCIAILLYVCAMFVLDFYYNRKLYVGIVNGIMQEMAEGRVSGDTMRIESLKNSLSVRFFGNSFSNIVLSYSTLFSVLGLVFCAMCFNLYSSTTVQDREVAMLLFCVFVVIGVAASALFVWMWRFGIKQFKILKFMTQFSKSELLLTKRDVHEIESLFFDKIADLLKGSAKEKVVFVKRVNTMTQFTDKLLDRIKKDDFQKKTIQIIEFYGRSQDVSEKGEYTDLLFGDPNSSRAPNVGSINIKKFSGADVVLLFDVINDGKTAEAIRERIKLKYKDANVLLLAMVSKSEAIVFDSGQYSIGFIFDSGGSAKADESVDESVFVYGYGSMPFNIHCDIHEMYCVSLGSSR